MSPSSHRGYGISQLASLTLTWWDHFLYFLSELCLVNNIVQNMSCLVSYSCIFPQQFPLYFECISRIVWIYLCISMRMTHAFLFTTVEMKLWHSILSILAQTLKHWPCVIVQNREVSQKLCHQRKIQNCKNSYFFNLRQHNI